MIRPNSQDAPAQARPSALPAAARADRGPTFEEILSALLQLLNDAL